MLVSKLHPVREEWVQFFFARNLAFIFFQSQKDRGGISLDNSWRITVGHRMQQQLLCMRTSAVMQAHNSCCATEDTDCLNNISCLYQ